MINKDSRIDSQIKSKLVAEIYGDEWEQGDVVRVDFKDEGQRMMSFEALQNLIKRRGWETEEYGNSFSKGMEIYKEYTKRRCCDCSAKPLYDSVESEWYCPKCNG